MTNQEAIDVFMYEGWGFQMEDKSNGGFTTPPSKEEKIEAMRVAIKALEQEPCEDAISRKAAIDAIREAENHAFNGFYKGLLKAHKIIADLPSVQLQTLGEVMGETKNDGPSQEDGLIHPDMDAGHLGLNGWEDEE